MADTIPCSAAYFPIFAFTSGVAFKYGDLFPSWCFVIVVFTSLLASAIEVEGTNLLSDPWGSGKVGSLGQDSHLNPNLKRAIIIP